MSIGRDTRYITSGADVISNIDIDKTVLEKRFDELDRPARAIFEGIMQRGVIKKIAGEFDYNYKLKGAPELKKDSDGFLYPVNAVIEAEIDGEKYVFELKRQKWASGDYLDLRIHFNPKNLGTAEKFLAIFYGERIVITRKYRNSETLKRFFEYISQHASMINLKPGRHNQLPRMIIDSNLGLLPVDMAVEVKLDDAMYKFTFSTGFGEYIIDAECGTDNTGYIQHLMERVIQEMPEKGKEKVQSLFSPLEVKEYTWGDVGGLGRVREELRELIEYPLRNPQLFRHMDIAPPKGILLIGPPGTGKTIVAKILANETNSIFYTVSPKDINSMWYGESERNIGRLFSITREGVKRGDTVIIFIDEIDGFYTNRKDMNDVTRRAFSQLCSEMDGISDLEGVIVIGATNRYQDLDPALVRPGRFDRKIFIGLPDMGEREEIFHVHLRKKPLAPDVDMRTLASRTDGLSGAEIENVCQKAGYLTIKRYAQEKEITIIDIVGIMIEEIRITSDDLGAALKDAARESAQATVFQSDS